MDFSKDIASVNHDSDLVGASAASRLFSESGFVKAEAFQLSPSGSPGQGKRLLLEDYKGFGTAIDDLGKSSKSSPDSPVYRDFNKQIRDQLKAIQKGPAGRKRAPETGSNGEPQLEPPAHITESISGAEMAYRASHILKNNWDSIDYDGDRIISRPEIYAAARRHARDPVKGPAFTFLRDNINSISNLYRDEPGPSGGAISKDDLNFLGSLSRAARHDYRYHEKANNYLKQNFEILDTDGNGTLSHDELSAKLEKTKAGNPEADLLTYSMNRQQENYSDSKDIGYEYNSKMASPEEISRKDLDMTLDERLAKSREDIFIQNYYSRYGHIGTGLGVAGAFITIAIGEALTGDTGFFLNWRVSNPIFGTGALIGRKAGSYFDRLASQNYFHKHQAANLKSLLDTNTGSF